MFEVDIETFERCNARPSLTDSLANLGTTMGVAQLRTCKDTTMDVTSFAFAALWGATVDTLQ